jgi:outer membrane protein assembly factor BamB
VLDSSQSIGFRTTPALIGNKVIFGSQDGTISALDTERGILRWSRTLGSAIQSAVVDSGNCVYFATQDGRLVRLDARDGHDLGEMQLGARMFGPPVITTDGLLAFVVEEGKQSGEPEVALRCVATSLTALRWTQRIPGGWTSSRPYLWRHVVLAGGEHGYLAALRTRDGAPMWSDSLRGTIRAISSNANRLYIGTLGGTLFAYDPPDTTR